MRQFSRFDDYGLVPVPRSFYFLLLFLFRAYLLWLVVLTMSEGGDRLMRVIYPNSQDFIIACVIASPMLLMLLVLSQRKVKSWSGWFWLWRHCKWPLVLLTAADLAHSVSHLPAFVTVTAPGLLLAP